MTRPACILGEGSNTEKLDDKLVVEVPEEFKSDFEADINQALRDVAGIANTVIHPFISDQSAIIGAFGKPLSILNWQGCDFETTTLKILKDKIRNTEHSRFVHLDLALTSDSAGVACGYVPCFQKMDRGGGIFEIFPNIVFDFVLEVPPPKGGEINFEKIRKLIIMLRSFGIPIKWVSADSYQSTDTLQILGQQGVITGIRSTDKNSKIYDVFKTAMQDGRVFLPTHDKALKELRELERDAKTGKVDHPPRGSKDLADSIAGVVYGLSVAGRVWAEHNINPSYIPASITAPSDPLC